MKNRLLIVFFSCFSFALSAQNPQQIIEYADRLAAKGEYMGAVQFYRTAMEIDSANTYLLYQYGMSLRKLNKLKNAAFYLEKVSRLDWENRFPENDFELAETYFQLAEYRYADRFYRRALRPYRRDENSKWYKRINQRMQSVDYAKSAEKKIQYPNIEYLEELNSFDSEFAPVLLNDSTMLFASLRADSLSSNNRIKDYDYYSRIYRSKLKADSTWAEPELLSQNVNIPGWDIANPAFDQEDNLLYFSKCDTNANCEIWASRYHAGQFQSAEKLGEQINSLGSNNTQAFPAEIDGKKYLFFASDRTGGFGQLDIWYSLRNENGTYAEAINAGAEINSIDNEITPYYSGLERRLYFASTWHNTHGGYDIFFSSVKAGNFSVSENAGKNINSPYNDFYFRLGADKMFFVSDRMGDANNCCCNNIYSAEYLLQPPKMEKITTVKQIASSGKKESIIPQKVTVDILNQYLPVELYFHNDYPDPNSWDTSTTANYSALINDYLSMKGEYVDMYSDNFEGNEKTNAAAEISAFFENEIEQGFEKLKFFMPLLVKELEKGNKIKMTVKGYASSLSGSDYNLNLTLRRIESLINYLKNYRDGILLPYIQAKADNGGELIFTKLPFGDYVNSTAQELIGDMQIYSIQAAKNRKIEILAITESKDGARSLDGSAIGKKPKIKFNSKSYQLELKPGSTISPSFLLKNTGEDELKLYAVDVNCECAKLEYPDIIEPNTEGKLSVTIDTKGLSGRKKISLLVISNAVPNIQNLSIELLIKP